jgi:hypothetical protein
VSNNDDHVTPGAEVPVSAGIPSSARYLMVAAVLVIFIQGAIVVGASAFGRIWPAANSTKVQLP